MRRRVGDCIKFNLGDRVRERDDGRHEGRIDANNGMISYVPLRDLERVRQ
jgi:hypothetical protein